MNLINRALMTACAFALAPQFLSAQTPNNGAPGAPVSYTSVAELNQIVTNLRHASQSAQDDLSHLRVEKWKTDGGTKRQTQNDAESILRNLQNAMPSILADLQNSPENLALTFKAYRNLDALYDVLSSVVESAGAFGTKEEFQSLNNDLGAIDSSRHAFADRMDKLASSKETEIGELRVALQNARAATPPKKVVVDDTETAPAKKPATHKKTTKPAPKPATGQPPTQNSGSGTPQQ